MLLAGELLCVSLLIVLACLAITIAKQRWAGAAVYGLSAAITAAGLCLAVYALGTASSAILTLPIGLPWIGSHFRLDPLSAAFLCVVNLGGMAASVFAIGYGKHEEAQQRVLPFYAAFLAAMNLVVMADDAFTFLLSWEVMSLMSWALVVSHDKDPEARHAGLVYILMASLGTLALMLAFGVLAGHDGQFAFDAMRLHGLSAGGTMLVLLLALFGAGSKAGIFPLHAWLPLAHPAAPSHVSALMSGVMTKVAVYAFVRIAFDLLGPIDWRLSMVVISTGGVTAVMGVLYALMQHDIKRLLAYHTVENIGIIFVGLGLALAFKANGLAAAAALALTAALFHVFNHSVFKNLLFFGSGAVQTATGERHMDHLGGLIHRMPATALAFLIGAAAISALPPLNGFASEWMTFQAVFLSPTLPQWGLRFASPVAGALLALAAALAAACFVKAYGVIFLGRARTTAAASAKEADKASLAAMLGLAGLCVFAGLFPSVFTNLLGAVALLLGGARMPASASIIAPLTPTMTSHNSYSALAVFLCVALTTAAIAYAVHLIANRATRRSAIWDCGFPEDNPASQYTASSFAQPIRRVFGSIAFRARETVVMPEPGDLGPARLTVTLHDPAWETFYAPVGLLISWVTERINVLQFQTIRRYLGVVFVTLVILLAVLAVWA
jgi:formate hydrogenlyase subunit 3/multisubunit Na+/H+ antiporter MnhD subunit